MYKGDKIFVAGEQGGLVGSDSVHNLQFKNYNNLIIKAR